MAFRWRTTQGGRIGRYPWYLRELPDKAGFKAAGSVGERSKNRIIFEGLRVFSL